MTGLDPATTAELDQAIATASTCLDQTIAIFKNRSAAQGAEVAIVELDNNLRDFEPGQISVLASVAIARLAGTIGSTAVTP